jgi:hypothetical protein
MRDAAAPVGRVEIAGFGGENAFRPDQAVSEQGDIGERDLFIRA